MEVERRQLLCVQRHIVQRGVAAEAAEQLRVACAQQPHHRIRAGDVDGRGQRVLALRDAADCAHAKPLLG